MGYKKSAAMVIMLLGLCTMLFSQQAVLDDGSFSYSIPIDTPGGDSILKPDLSINYNSNSPQGELGLGWFLAGLSTIEIDPTSEQGRWSFTIDGQKLIYNEANDVYVTEHNNHYLIKKVGDTKWVITDTSGTVYTYGQYQKEYTPAIGYSNSYSKWLLTEVRDLNNNFYTIDYKNYTYYFGSLNTSTFLPETITVGHNTNTTLFKMKFIWIDKQNGLKKYYLTMKKSLKLLDSIEIQTANASQINKYKLNYNYTYAQAEAAGTGATPINCILSSINLYGINNTENRIIAEIDWTGDFALVKQDPFQRITPAGYQSLLKADDGVNIIPGDFNGDGKTDFIRQEKNGMDDDNTFTFNVYFSNGDGTFNGVTPQGSKTIDGVNDDYQYFLKGDYAKIHTGDFNGDGMTDFIRQEYGLWGKDNNHTFQVFYSKGDGYFDIYQPGYFSGRNAGDSKFACQSELGFDQGRKILASDFNGDGITDFITQTYGTWGKDATKKTFMVFFSTGKDGEFEYVAPTHFNRITNKETYQDHLKGDNTRLTLGDFNGDGKKDFLVQGTGEWAIGVFTSFWVYFSNGDGTFSPVMPSNSHQDNAPVIGELDGYKIVLDDYQDLLNGNRTVLYPGDYNGDGMTDFIRMEAADWDDDGVRNFQVYYSRGYGFFEIKEPPTWYQDKLKYDGKGYGEEAQGGVDLIPGDYNGDGKTDFIRLEKNKWDDDNTCNFMVFYSTGNDGLFDIAYPIDSPVHSYYQTNIKVDGGNGDKQGVNLFTGDYNGDGSMDFIRQEKGDWDNDEINNFEVFLSKAKPLKVKMVTEPQTGKKITIGYIHLSDTESVSEANVYSNELNTGTKVKDTSPAQLVASISISDGLGGTMTSRYEYGKRYRLSGNRQTGKSLGFETRTVINPDNSSVKYYFTLINSRLWVIDKIEDIGSDGQVFSTKSNEYKIEEKNYNGRTGYTINISKRITKLSNLEKKEEFVYDAYGNVTSQSATDGYTSFSKSQAIYLCDTNNYVVNKPLEVTEYNPATGKIKRILTNTYDNNYNLKAVTVKKDSNDTGIIFAQYNYNNDGTLESSTDGNNNKTSYDYYGNHLLKQVTGTDQRKTLSVYDEYLRLSSQTDPNGVVTLNEYDNFHQLVKKTRKVEGSNTESHYMTYGYSKYISATSPRSTKTSNSWNNQDIIVYFDALGRIVQTKIGNPTSGYSTSDSYFEIKEVDENGKTSVFIIRKDSTIYTASSDVFNRDTTQPFNKQSFLPGSRKDSIITGIDGNRISSCSTYPLITKDYDSEGNLKTSSDLNAMGRVWRVVDYEYPSAITLKTYNGPLLESVFDDIGKQTLTSYTYDHMDRLKTAFSLEAGTITYDEYDNNNNLIQTTDAKGQKIICEFDKFNRLTQKKIGDSRVISYFYDEPATGYYNKGHLTRVSDSRFEDRYFYDYNGFLTKITRTIDNIGKTIEYSYSPDGKKLTTTLPDGSKVENEYNNGKDLLENIYLKTTTNQVVDSKTLMSKTYGNNNSIQKEEYLDGSYTDYVYSSKNGLIQKVSTGINNTYFQDFSYIYDTERRITSISNASDNRYDWNYTYDKLGRLTKATGDFDPRTYEYDYLGNLTKRNGVDYTYAHPTNPYAVTNDGFSTYTYDKNGNMKQKIEKLTLKQDVFNNPKIQYKNLEHQTLDGRNHPYYNNFGCNVSKTSFTAAFWFKTGSSNTELYQHSDNSKYRTNRHKIYISGGNLRYLLNGETLSSNGGNYADNQWHHAAVTLGGNTGNQKLYVDGVLQATGSQSSSTFKEQNIVMLGNSYVGEIDDFIIYRDGLKGEDIKSLYLYSGPLPLEQKNIPADSKISYHFNSVSGNTITDESGNGNDAAKSGIPVWKSENNGVLSFDGDDNYVEIPDLNMDYTKGFTASAWVYYEGFNNNSRIFDLSNGPWKDHVTLFNYANTSKLGFFISNSSKQSTIYAADALETGKWLHLAVTMDGAGNVKLYKNGTKISSGTVSLPNNVSRSMNYLGKSPLPEHPAYFDGKMDDVLFYNKALSGDEVAKLVVNLSDISDNYVAGYSPSSVGTAYNVATNNPCHPLIDTSGNGNNATFVNAFIRNNESTFNFNGTDKSIVLPDLNLDYTKGFSASMVVQPFYFFKCPYNGTLFEFSNGSTDKILLSNVEDTSTLLLRVGNTSITVQNFFIGGASIHIGITIDGSGNTTIYRNGKAIKTASLSLPANVTRTYNQIGKSYSTGGFVGDSRNMDGYFNGEMSNIFFYNRAVNSKEMAFLGQNFPNDYKARYSFSKKEINGTVITSAKGNGTLKGSDDGPQLVDGKYGKALSFDGKNDYASLPDNNWDFTKGFSSAAWIYYDGFNSYSRIFEFSNSKGNHIVLCNEATSNSLLFLVYNYNGGQTHINAGDILETGKWIHLAVSMDGSGNVTIYKNGKAVETSNSYTPHNETGYIPHVVNRTQNWLGKSSNSQDGYFDGMMDDVLFYNRPLSDTEVALLADPGWRNTEITTEYIYDEENQLLDVKKEEATLMIARYDHNGQRYKKTDSSGTTYYYFPEYEVRNQTPVYHYNDGKRIFASRQNGDTFFYHRDHLGSTTAITSTGSTDISKSGYFPFGEVAFSESSGFNNSFGYTGQINDGTGLYYYNARYYNPALGKFITADTVISGGGLLSQALNPYSYVFNNPVNLNDPTGHDPFIDFWEDNWEQMLSITISVGFVGLGMGISVLSAGTLRHFGSAFTNAGVNGIMYTSTNWNDFRWEYWGALSAVGFVVGLYTGGISAATSSHASALGINLMSEVIAGAVDGYFSNAIMTGAWTGEDAAKAACIGGAAGFGGGLFGGPGDASRKLVKKQGVEDVAETQIKYLNCKDAIKRIGKNPSTDMGQRNLKTQNNLMNSYDNMIMKSRSKTANRIRNINIWDDVSVYLGIVFNGQSRMWSWQPGFGLE